MNVQTLNARLTSLFDSLKQTQRIITRLSKSSAQSNTNHSDLEDEDSRLELGAEIHQSLKEQEEDFELLRQECEDYTDTSSWSHISRRRERGRDSEKTDLAAQVTRLGEDLKTCVNETRASMDKADILTRSARAQFRKAQLQAKRNAEALKRKERQLLFAGIQEGSQATNYGHRKGQEQTSQEELLVNASNDVTAALRRTHNLMTNELERSRFAQETLENSTKDLAKLSESYSNLDTLLSSSRSLVSTLIHSQKSDTWYLESAFYILTATIAWLFFRRIIYGPGWWLLYLPTKLTLRLILFPLQILFGALSSVAGSVGARNQSLALSQSSSSISTSLAQISTGLGSIPKRHSDQSIPSIRVGAGGYGAKMQPPAHQAERSQEIAREKSMSEQVGELAEQSKTEEKPRKTEADQSVKEHRQEHDEEHGQQHEYGKGEGTVLKERTSRDGPPNPKKRMWEEPIDTDQHVQPRDEL